MSNSDIIDELQRLGMSAYEAKAYSALVADGTPLTGYEVAKRSRIPRSTVYETLGKLVSRGAAYEVRNSTDSTEYICLPPQVLFERMERDFHRSVDTLKAEMPYLATTPKAHLIHNIEGRKPLLDRAEDIIVASKNSVFVSGWPSEIESLKPLLRKSEARGVDVSVVSFGSDSHPVGTTIEHRYSSPEVVRENLGCKLAVIATDREHVVIGGLDNNDGWGVYTDDTAVVLVAIEYIRHDMALHLIAQRMDTDTFAELWETDSEIRRLRSDHGMAATYLAHNSRNHTNR